jgi:hypothetical protein
MVLLLKYLQRRVQLLRATRTQVTHTSNATPRSQQRPSRWRNARQYLKDVAEHRYFSRVVMCLILANTICMVRSCLPKCPQTQLRATRCQQIKCLLRFYAELYAQSRPAQPCQPCGQLVLFCGMTACAVQGDASPCCNQHRAESIIMYSICCSWYVCFMPSRHLCDPTSIHSLLAAIDWRFQLPTHYKMQL